MQPQLPPQEMVARFETIMLERLKVAGITNISNVLLDSAEVSVSETMTMAMDQTMIRLATRVLAHDQGKVTITFPATWWDHLKRDRISKIPLVGRWYVRRHPVRESAIPLRRWAKFPGAEIAYPRGLGPVRIETLDLSGNTYDV